MSRDEWASQIGYLKVLLQLLLNKNTGDGTLLAADADTDAAIDAAVDAVNEEADSPETFSLTDAQYDTLRQGIDDGAYAAAYSVSTLGSLRRLNSLLAKLTDLVETNDIAGFVDIYQQACDLYSGISDKLPEALKKLYDALVRITELENMKDLVICLNKLSTATRGFGLYTITSENGKLTLDTLTRDGFGDPFNHGLRAFAVNDEQGWMVIGTANPFMGTQLWRTTVDMTDPMDRFTDLDPNGWAYPSIEYCVRHGLMSGMSDTIFSPNTVLVIHQDITDQRLFVIIPFADDIHRLGTRIKMRTLDIGFVGDTQRPLSADCLIGEFDIDPRRRHDDRLVGCRRRSLCRIRIGISGVVSGQLNDFERICRSRF